ncbi:MAG: S8 family serine peptidase, partial [Asgard group archaeon]|nr:S8 family serine peptidase [Asgard group archaeon]
MKHGKIFSLIFLSLLAFSLFTPSVILNANLSFPNTSSTKIYQKTIIDVNGDKIDDNFAKEIDVKGKYLIDAVLTFDHKMKSNDHFNLLKLGVTTSNEFWDQGHRTIVTTTSNNLVNIAKLAGLTSITSGEKRVIIVGIQGKDTSDLEALKIFKDVRIFHSIGCAIIRYYTGVENDIKLLGDYTLIADTTDSRFYPTVEIDENTDFTSKYLLINTATFLNATGMWAIGYDGSGIKVGNIDTGINVVHDAISGRIGGAQSFITSENNYDHEDLTITDPTGHGSHTSGIIMANDLVDANNRGMAPDALLYMAKVGAIATVASILEAINWLTTVVNVSVINFSYGGTDSPGYDAVQLAFANTIKNNNILVCISASNEGSGTYTIGTPGSTDDVLTVGALYNIIIPSVASYSSRGLTADNHLKPDVLAPGTNIYSLSRVGDDYVYMSATSMAAPHLTGAVALLVEACNANSIAINPGVFKAALMKSCTAISGTSVLAQGRGYVNIGKAWNYIQNASRVDNTPLIGVLNPTANPIPWFDTLLQGQVHEQYLTTVSSQKINKTLE